MPLYKTISLSWYLWILFAIHRGLAFPYLHNIAQNAEINPSLEIMQYLIVGLLSDFWVATLLSISTYFLSFVIILFIKSSFLLFRKIFSKKTKCPPYSAFIGKGSNGNKTATLAILGVGFATACHQSYVEFFRFQLVPFHVSYLIDASFLGANATSLAGPESLIIVVFTFALCGLAHLKVFLRRPHRWTVAYGFVFMILAGLFAHNRNIHYRVQWFVPLSLQMNYIENLYALNSQNTTIDPLDESEWLFLKSALKKLELGDLKDPKNLIKLLSPEIPKSQDLNPIYEDLKTNFATKIKNEKQPLIIVFILESLRPSETGIFNPKARSITPNIDNLASKGIFFKKAYATGSVTRGGQEATLCGMPSQRDFSMMRGGILLDYPYCLFKIVDRYADTFWYHGGEARFDNQYSFWRAQGVQDLMSSLDFPENAPRTSWGIGDITFLNLAAERLESKPRNKTIRFKFGSILTVTNHIPWDIPSDIDPKFLLDLPIGLSHPSYRTTAYTDEAIGRFANRLKTSGLWDQSLIIFVSDHGTPLPPLNQLYLNSPTKDLHLYSHINLFLSGGITEETVSQNSDKPFVIDQFVSQASVAPFVWNLIDPGPQPVMMADHLFSKVQTLPVLSVVENTLFDPRTEESWKVASAVKKPEGPTSQNLDFRLVYFRALLQSFSTVSPGKSK